MASRTFPNCTITLTDAGHHEATWSGATHSDAYREIMTYTVSCIEEQPKPVWLADMRDFKPVAKADQAWTVTEWFPQVIGAGLKKMAVVMPKSAIAGMAAQRTVNSAGEVPIETQYFSDPAEARAWLRAA